MNNEKIVTLFAENRHPYKLGEDEVTVSRLSTALDAAVMIHSVDDDGDLYISDGADFPLWLSIRQKSRSLHLFTYWRSSATESQVNEANQTYRAVQFALEEDRIWASYYLPYQFGLDARHLIIMIRQFGGICRKAYEDMGEKNAEKEHEQDDDTDALIEIIRSSKDELIDLRRFIQKEEELQNEEKELYEAMIDMVGLLRFENWVPTSSPVTNWYKTKELEGIREVAKD